MLEIAKLRVINWAERMQEKKPEGTGIVFVPYDWKIREISAALLIDGAMPSEINNVVLDIFADPEENGKTNSKDRLDSQLRDVQDALRIEGADKDTINQFSSAVREESASTRKYPLLNPYQPVRRVDLSTYNTK